MTYIPPFNRITELRKAAQGKKTKLPPELLVYLALDRYPAIQKQIGKAFGIREYPTV